eukprot:4679218-Alexandrium_andersonii.AAC.1
MDHERAFQGQTWAAEAESACAKAGKARPKAGHHAPRRNGRPADDRCRCARVAKDGNMADYSQRK